MYYWPKRSAHKKHTADSHLSLDYVVPRAHSSPQPKKNLDRRLSGFYRARHRDRQTDRPRYFIRNNSPRLRNVTLRCGLKRLLFSERSRSLYAVARPSVVCLSHPTQPVEIFRSFSSCLVPWPSVHIQRKFYGDRHTGTHPSGELNARGVAKYSDFVPIEGYVSETVQDRK